MEKVDLYDINRKSLNQQFERGTKMPDNTYRLVVHVCIFNTQGQMLIQQRQSFKRGWPNLWDVSVGGGVDTGETSNVAAERELFEELGVAHSFKDSRPHLSISFATGFDDFYVAIKDLKLEDLSLQETEVKDAKWATKNEIIEMINNNEFINYHTSFIDYLFDSYKLMGTHKLA